MKLTNTIREAFVRAAMDDVPEIDYQDMVDKLVKTALRECFAKTFPGVDYDKACQSGWLSRRSVYTPGTLSNVYTFAPEDYNFLEGLSIWGTVQEYATLHTAQAEARRELTNKLSGVARSVTTRKALVAALPEFEKYLPPEDGTTSRMTPVVQNVVADFVKAGWPKGHPQATGAAA